MRLASCLRCTLLLGPAYESTVVHLSSLFRTLLIFKTLRSFTLLHSGECLVVIVTLEELLNAWSLQLGLMLEHLF